MSQERIKEVAEQILARVGATKGRGEEATKQALILPMLSALGYDIWDPREVCPEYDADFAIKKNGQKEKVDIAIFRNDVPVIYIEAKASDVTDLSGHQGQLARYFNATQSVVLGILTNGIEWRFYTDTTDQNVMDESPFHVAKLDAIDQGLDVLSKFTKGQPVIETTRSYATELRYTERIASFIKRSIDIKDRNPDEEFMRWILKSEDSGGELIYKGVVNANVLHRFEPIIKNALTRVIRDIVRRSITAMDEEVTKPDEPQSASSTMPIENTPSIELASSQESGRKTQIVTSDEEIALFNKIQTIFEKATQGKNLEVYEPSVRRSVPAMLDYKDTSAYFGIYINKVSWWIIRAYVDSKNNKWIGFDLPVERAKTALPEGMILLPPSAMAEVRVALDSINEIERLENMVLMSIEYQIQKHQASSDPEEAPVFQE